MIRLRGSVFCVAAGMFISTPLSSHPNVLLKDMMEEALAEQLFTQHYPAAVHHERELIIQLLRALQYLPLAIIQVAAYLRRNRACLLANYVELFNTCQRRLLSQPFKDLRREANNETILTTLLITFRQVQEQSLFRAYSLS